LLKWGICIAVQRDASLSPCEVAHVCPPVRKDICIAV
jgi:hypothetical protein